MESLPTKSPTRALSSESSFSGGGAADTFSHVASLSSTPPTTADSISLASEEPQKQENVTTTEPIDESTTSISVDNNVDEPAQPTTEAVTPTPTPTPLKPTTDATVDELPQPQPIPGTPIRTPATERGRRQRVGAPVYNLAKLSGTAMHGKRRAKGDIVADRRRRTISGDGSIKTPEGARVRGGSVADDAEEEVKDGINALDLASTKRGSRTPSSKPVKKETKNIDLPPRRIATRSRSSGPEAETLTQKFSVLGKRSRKPLEKGASRLSRELRRLQDTNEYAGIDTKPVIYTTWANGKYVDEDEEPEPPKKRAKVSESPKKAVAEPEPAKEKGAVVQKRRVKQWLDRGLYAGQETPMDIFKGLTTAEKKKLAQLPELMPSGKVNKALPMPIFTGLRILLEGRDFKLPFDVCNPLPPGQPKPDEWRKMTKNRFVGDAAAYWKKTPHFKDYQSKCVCTREDGCGESCQNRIMLYECDSTNCNVGPEFCQNRAFARLQERTKAGGKYRVGVEVIKTEDRGYGIRSNRCFEPNQIIMEYTGEIITEEECDRRMNEKYKNNQNMIIDATTGSIARFVNHSCEPNCRMIKWIVSGQPRMALFAGDRPIMTGEELTYDYKFDPFSAKNVQKCLCGSTKCRGVLGPKPKEVKLPKQAKEAKEPKETLNVRKSGTAGKRKRADPLDDRDDGGESSAMMKRKVKSPAKATAGKKITTSYGAIKAKTTAAALKRTLSKMSASTKSALPPKSAKSAKPAQPAKSPRGKVATVKKSGVVRTYGMTKVQTKLGGMSIAGSSKSSLTIVAAGSEAAKQGDASPVSAKSKNAVATPKSKVGRPRKNASSSTSPRKAVNLTRSPTKIKLVRSPSSQAT
ncbi:hypothetical protein DL764_003024 [Monosporascus ibericus]|uniref:Histone-lysine N-methyltransferase n=1 Tax=Monosporascus ibericus TaxID=155417 RepID=A0A4Q4TJC3_9PEZI|nr:hypothetical protein DL764_003024 [Monosporascus ibericus]